MFSAFKKLTTKQENGAPSNSSSLSPGNVQCMSTNLQKKFARVKQPHGSSSLNSVDLSSIFRAATTI